MRKPVIALSVLLAVCTLSIAGASAAPRAYFGLGSVGAGLGYHAWTRHGPGRNQNWWDVNYSALEAAYFLRGLCT